MQDKRPYNEKGEPHGYWETNWKDGKPWFKENYINGEQCGLYQWYNHYGDLKDTKYYAR
jgi:hypothetical protein